MKDDFCPAAHLAVHLTLRTRPSHRPQSQSFQSSFGALVCPSMLSSSGAHVTATRRHSLRIPAEELTCQQHRYQHTTVFFSPPAQHEPAEMLICRVFAETAELPTHVHGRLHLSVTPTAARRQINRTVNTKHEEPAEFLENTRRTSKLSGGLQRKEV